MRILIVDDEVVSMKKLKNLLSIYGSCDVAFNGEKAIEMFMEAHQQNYPYVLVTLDIGLPDVSGIEVLKGIRTWENEESKIRQIEAVKVLMVTADNCEEVIKDSISAGCSNYIVKPFDEWNVKKVLSKLWKTDQEISNGTAENHVNGEKNISEDEKDNAIQKILIVDDEIVSIGKLKLLLKKYGQCDTASNGKDALSMFSKALLDGNPYSLVTLDINIPDMKGSEILKEIRRIELENNNVKEGENVSVLMVSALNDQESVMESIKSGCTNYLTKPFDREKLEKALMKVPQIKKKLG